MTHSIQEQPFKNEIATIDDRTGMGVETLKQAILENLRYVVGKDPESATGMDYFMAKLMTGKIGDSWISNLEHLKQLEAYAEDSGFRAAWRKTQYDVKVRLAQYILEDTGYSVDPASVFDTQVKRLHEYKLQHLNVLYILTLYLRLKRNPRLGRYWASGRVITSDSSLFSRGRCVRARRTADPSAGLGMTRGE